MQKLLIILGVILLLAGLGWPWLKRLPIGRLPGDITIPIGNGTLYLPLGTALLVSVVLSLLLRLLR